MRHVNEFARLFRSRRLELGLTLREFCRRHDFDVGNTSKLERGLMDPPKARAALEAYAKALELAEGSEMWQTFFDLAAISSGRIPDRVMDDPKLVARLPMVFRTIKGQKLTEAQLRQLAEDIGEA